MPDDQSIIATKKCTKCQNKWPATVEYFYLRSGSKQSFRSHCRECLCSKDERKKGRIRAAARRKSDPEHARVIARRSYANNKEDRRAEARSYQKKHRAQARARLNAWRGKYPERVRESVRASDHRRYYRDVAKARERGRLGVLKRNTRKKQLPHLWSKELWQWCLEYWGYVCAYCGREESAVMILSMEHVVPFWSKDCPGTVPWNMVPACHGRTGCNMRKNKKPVSQFLEEVFGAEEGARKLRALEEFLALALQQYQELLGG